MISNQYFVPYDENERISSIIQSELSMMCKLHENETIFSNLNTDTYITRKIYINNIRSMIYNDICNELIEGIRTECNDPRPTYYYGSED